MKNELFHHPSTPLALTRPALRDSFYHNERRAKPDSQIEILGALEIKKLDKIIKVLEHPGLNDLIISGQLTFGAIKPRTQISKLDVADDDEGEKKLLEMVASPLDVIFTVSLAPTEQQLNEFYPAEVRDRLSVIKTNSGTVWSEFSDQMLSGPVTYFLLYDPNGNAVEEWRRQIGSTNPVNADPNSIRGKYAVDIKLNLVHGSSGDTAAEKASNVKSEVDWLKDRLIDIKNSSSEKKYFPSEDTLRQMSIISADETLVMGSIFSNYKRVGGEKFMAVYSLLVQKPDGSTEIRYIAEKAIVSFGNIEVKTRTEVDRLKFLEKNGVKIPRIYGINNGSILQEFIPNEVETELGIKYIKSKYQPLEDRKRLLDELIVAARAIDENGFILIGSMLEEMLYDGHDFYFIDGGSDLGESHLQNSNTNSFNELLKIFKDDPELISYIVQSYPVQQKN